MQSSSVIHGLARSKLTRRLASASGLLFPMVSIAQTNNSIGSAADTAASNFPAVVLLLQALTSLIAIVFFIKSLLQFKEHTENPAQVKLSKPIVSAITATFLFTFATTVDSLVETFLAVAGGAGFSAIGLGGAENITQASGLDGMAIAFAANIPALMTLVGKGATIAGAFLILRAILLLPQLEQGRVEGSKVIWTFISGVGLWALLPMISTALTTIGMASGEPTNILTAKFASSGTDSFGQTIGAILKFVQLLGLIAFVRGMLILKAMGENKDGAMGRAMTHIFGGAAAMNITWSIALLAHSMGASGPICGIATGVICAF